MDLRIRLTKEMLKDTLIRLLEKEDIKYITIKELCLEAGINRTTFYKYYSDVFDVLYEIENDLFENVSSVLKSNEDNSVKDVLEALIVNNKYIKVFLLTEADEKFKYKIIDFIDFAFPKRKKNNDLYRDFSYTGVYYLMVNWLKGKYDVSVDEFAKIIENIFKSIYSE
ncbi:MAG: TetR/AcrR family transcriptional regulator [Acholeplasmatales bacterium]|nr:TetR/AcrR family transcriptional regulator [Acholeplasmatales bacterium]